jgi:cell division protein FtsI/penicillin-binding protein 2
MNGQPLISMSTDYAIGVYPGKLKNASSTANSFAADVSPSAMELDPQQVLGQIQAAPPGDFLTLLTLSPSDFARLWPKLSKVNGISYTEQAQRLFSSPAQNIVGTVGTEDSPQLINEGAAYQPGMTIGLSGYEQTYQDTLTGTPTTTVEVVNSAGHVTHQWPVKGGQAGTPVQTTLNLTAQTAAANALAAQPSSAELVAVDTQTGAIRAEGTHTAGSVALPTDKGPLADEIAPGMAFSIVSTAALLSTGVTAKTPLPCEPVTSVGGETFTSSAQASSSATFASDFADACGTAFANLSRNLTAQQLATAEKDFGLGTTWQLQPTTAFSGSAPPLAGTNEGGVAEQATGSGGVLVSPLGMAIMAAEVATGVGHTPSLLVSDPPTKWDAPLTAADLGELQQLMRNSVANGAANAANLSGTPVYGQAGIVQTAKGKYLSWFVGYRGTLAVAAVETGTSPTQAAANLVAQFLKSATK